MSSTKKSGLMGSGFGFTIGSKKEQIEQDRTQQSAARSQVGSLSGDTAIYAGNHYQQTGSIVTSRDGDVDITAKSANITAARSDYESNYKRTTEQKGVTVAISTPITNAIQAVENTINSAKAVGSSKNDRINALGAVNAGFEAMRTAEQVGKLAEALSQKPTQALSQDVSVSITYGEQKSVETQHSEGNKVEKSQINAGGKVNINTKGDGKNSTLTIAGSDVSGKGGTHLKAEGGVNMLAVDENHLERSKNKSSGFNAGVAISYGSSGFAFGVTAGGNVAKGYGNGESQAWVGSQVGSLSSQTTIESGGDDNIIGSQVKGKSVKVNAENLNIQSLQDTMKYEGKQESASGQVTVGYGFSASGSYSKSKANSNYAGVKTQAGIFAGDEGYDVDIRNHTDLNGGTLTSTEQSEQGGKNRFATNTLTYQDIYNHSDYSAKGFGLNGGFSVSGGEAPKEIAGVKLQQIGENHKDGSSKVEMSGVAGAASQGNWGVAKLATSLLGQVSDKGSESGITTASINTKNITIRDEQTQQQLTGKTAEEAAKEINKTNLHQEVNKVDIEKIKNDVERDLKTATDFVKNLHERGDEIYYRMEKNEDSVFSIQKKIEDCNHISCLDFKADNSQELKRIIYGDKILTDEQAQLLSKVATAGMLNLKREDKVSSAILYDKDLASIDETAVILNRGSAGVVNEFIFTGFERFRAWANLPGIFGASNATRDHAQINKKLEEYNAHQIAQGKTPINVNNVAHSLGVSGNKNMLNWSEYVGNEYKNTQINFSHLGGSYPSAEIDKQAKELFSGVNTEYHGAKGDFVYSGIGGWFIGNNPNARQVEGLGFGQAHSQANQNINNLKYVYKIDNQEDERKREQARDTLNKIYPNGGIREFNKVNEEK
ncbi:hemagglutinin repeat-containing protein [Bibersteinia trehalosi]